MPLLTMANQRQPLTKGHNMDIPSSAARAKALRHAACDSMITIANRLSIPAIDMVRMERGDAGYERTARRVVGHYMGRSNERARTTPVGHRIRALRHAAGHSATELADLIGVKPALLWAVEARPHMSRKTCRKIAEFYGVSASELEAA